jgi:LPS-assembly lipoprotein
MRKLNASFLIILLLSLSACGLKPLYGDGRNGAVSSVLGQVTVDPIEGKNGWLMTNALNDRLDAAKSSDAVYRLVVVLDDQIEGFGVRADDTVTRERRTLRARYQLVELASGNILLDATAGSDAGIDVVSSEFATIAAEDTALENLSQIVADKIISRLSLFALER